MVYGHVQQRFKQKHVKRNRGDSVAIIAAKPLRAGGGSFRLSQQLTNGQPCFLSPSPFSIHPYQLSSIQYTEQRFYDAKHGFIPLMARVCVCLFVCMVLSFI